MASNDKKKFVYGQKKKPTIGEKFNNAAGATWRGIKKAVLWTALLGGAVGGPAYYHIGTKEEVIAKIESQTGVGEWTSNGYSGGYIFTTDKGVFEVKNSMFHPLQGKPRDIYNKTNSNRTYRFEVYGVDGYGFKRNIVGYREISEQELAKMKAADEAAKKADEKKQQAGVENARTQDTEKQQARTQQQTTTGTAPQCVSGTMSGTLSGNFRMITVEMTNGGSVRLRVPAEMPQTVQDAIEVKTVNLPQVAPAPQTPQ